MHTDIGQVERHRGVLDAIFAFVAVLSRDGRILDCNNAPLRAMNTTREQVIGTRFVDTPSWNHSAEVRERVRQGIARAASGVSVRATLLVGFPSDRLVEMDVAFEPLRDTAGRVVQVVASGVDVSEQSRAARELERLLRQQEAIAGIGSFGLRTTDVDAFLSRVVDTVAQVLDCPLCGILELDSTGDSLALRAQVGLYPEAMLRRVPAGGRTQAGFTLAARVPVIVEDLRTETRFSSQPLLDHGVISGLSVMIEGSDRPYGVLSVHTLAPRVFGFEDVHFVQSAANTVADVIRRTAAEARLSRSERRYRTLASAGTQVVWTTDATGQDVTVLGDADYLRSYREKWAFEDGRPVVHPDDHAALTTAWTAALTDRTRLHAEYRLRRADGQWRNVIARGQPVLADDGSVEEWIGVVIDVTEQRRLQDQFRQAQKMEAIGQLAGGIAHDFNNLLTIICGCSGLLDELMPAAGQTHDLLTDVRDAAERAAALTRQLLAFSRKQVTAPRVLDVAQVALATESLLRRLIGEDITLVVSGSDTCTARLDRTQLEQVIINLAINARDAMPQGGTLTIDTAVAAREGLAAPESATGKHVVLTVRDTGSGMTPEVLAHLFEPFFTTKGLRGGSGLGLATVHGVIEQSGGTIGVESAAGVGTVFTIRLPFVDESPAPAPGPGLPSLPRGDETILLVEDDPGVRNFARHVLERCGYRVLAATDGVEAVRLARVHEGPIHLLVCDIVMPGAGGRIVAELVAEARPAMRRLFISGHTGDALLQHGIEESQVWFLPKPFLPHQLAQTVRKVLAAPGPPIS